ncbi:hypothetical protein Nepgr_015761 [Nepenthes gracilis]|uniref:Lon N-terminal domain-containing protein n=1 Tax=Nepenthes gracilis TaxID=150966 RepID=A0AAD3XRX1_NEPGR|nr:hypothetical protein Nepgr_015761 [Nepenthes gracilis]
MALPQLLSSTSSNFTLKSSLNPISSQPPSSLHSVRRIGRRKLRNIRCSASSLPEKHHNNNMNSPKTNDDVLELPLFPLPLVLFPGAILPLQIFEFRYRIMMHTLLHTDLRFGVIYTDSLSGTADVGCVGEIVKHERLVDDRFFLICKGQERFRISQIVRTKPYLVAAVSWLEDKPSGDGAPEDLDDLATEVEGYMRDVIRLSNRLNGKPEKEIGDLRRNLFPTPFSFFVGSTFEGAPREQQALLELEDTAARLRREKETLRNTLNYLSAASAVKDVFPSS